ncbi:MAG: phosphotransferase family protein [Actinomycetota bacterium]
MHELDIDDLQARANAAAQGWAPGCEVGQLEPLEGGTVGIVFSAAVLGGPPEHERIVLKVAPPGLPPVRNRDVLRQARCMAALGGQPGVGVPTVLFTDEGEPDDVPPFFASGFVTGECAEPLLDAVRNRRPDEIVRGRSFAAARMLAALHHVEPAAIGLGDEPETTLIGEVDRWTRTFDTVPDEVRTGYEACADALRATAPSAVPSVIVHGDYRLGNMLSEGTEVRAIIDWEIWSRSDPRIDLSWFLFFTEEAQHPVVAPGVDSGVPSDVELLAAYEEAVGAPVADLDWFHALTRYKEAAAMALIAKHAARRGDEQILARMSVMLPALIADARQRVS